MSLPSHSLCLYKVARKENRANLNVNFGRLLPRGIIKTWIKHRGTIFAKPVINVLRCVGSATHTTKDKWRTHTLICYGIKITLKGRHQTVTIQEFFNSLIYNLWAHNSYTDCVSECVSTVTRLCRVSKGFKEPENTNKNRERQQSMKTVKHLWR